MTTLGDYRRCEEEGENGQCDRDARYAHWCTRKGNHIDANSVGRWTEAVDTSPGYHEVFAPKRELDVEFPVDQPAGEWPGHDLDGLRESVGIFRRGVEELVANAYVHPKAYSFQFSPLEACATSLGAWMEFFGNRRPRLYTCESPKSHYSTQHWKAQRDLDAAEAGIRRANPDWVRLNKMLEAAGYQEYECFDCGGPPELDDFTDDLMDQMYGTDWRNG